ncbi:MAG TPA: CsgG/HfaB family protein [Chthonomonadaceae bacterium]|nr:CsgG/HfaB family protein [Chthonomonadaceae bacterium]
MFSRFMIVVGIGLGIAFYLPMATAQSVDTGQNELQSSRTRFDKGKSENNKTDHPIYKGLKKRLAVMDVEIKAAIPTITPSSSDPSAPVDSMTPPAPADFGTGLTEILLTALREKDQFVLFEHIPSMDAPSGAGSNSLGPSAAPTGANSNGGNSAPTATSMPPPSGPAMGARGSSPTILSDPTGSTNQTGSIPSWLPVQALVCTAVTECRLGRNGRNLSFKDNIDWRADNLEATIVLDMRIFDTATGEILYATSAEGHAKNSSSSFGVHVGGFGFQNQASRVDPLTTAVRQAITKAVDLLCDKLQEGPWEGRVVETDAEGDTVSMVYLDAGWREGVRVGDEFEILHPGRPIIEEGTGRILGRTKDKYVGRCRVEEVQEKIANATPFEGTGFQKGDVVRIARSGATTEQPSRNP